MRSCPSPIRIAALILMLLRPGFSIAQQESFSQAARNAQRARISSGALSQYVPRDVQVPNLVNESLADALANVQKAGLRMMVAAHTGDSSLVVIQQRPPAGSTVKSGTQIVVWVRQQVTENLVTVPDLYHHTEQNAREILARTNLQAGAIGQRPSSDQPGLVLDQSIAAGTQVKPGTTVNFDLSQKVQLTITRSPEGAVKPGDAVAFHAQLDPPLGWSEFQFTFGDGHVRAWSQDPSASNAFAGDADYTVTVDARWDGGSAESTLNLVVHPISYQVRLVPRTLKTSPGDPVTFRAEITPEVANATLEYHFGDDSQVVKSSNRELTHTYAQPNNYFPWVVAHITEPAPDTAAHSHAFSSARVMVEITAIPSPVPPRPPVWPWVIAGAAAAAAGLSARKLFRPGYAIVAHKDFGQQTIRDSSVRLGFEVRAVPSWGEQTIRSGGPKKAAAERHS